LVPVNAEFSLQTAFSVKSKAAEAMSIAGLDIDVKQDISGVTSVNCEVTNVSCEVTNVSC